MTNAGDTTLPLPLWRRGWQRVRPLLAGAAKAALRGLERLLHPVRRRQAAARVAANLPLRRVVVLCYGNICRSPYAASVMARTFATAGIGGEVAQGGFFGPDRAANERAQTVARARGTELAGHRSRVVTASEAREADLVVVMEAWHARKVVREFGARPERVLQLGDLDPWAVERRGIPDPYGHDPAVFTAVYDRIDRCVAELARLAQRA